MIAALPIETTHRVRCWVLRGYPHPRGAKPGVPRLVRYRALNIPSGKPAGFTATWRTRKQALKAKRQGLRRIYRRVVPALAWVRVEAVL